MSKYEDAEILMREIRMGKSSAFEYLFKVYYPRMHNFAIRYLKQEDTVRDVIQNTLITLYEKRDSFFGATPSGILFTTLRNQCLSELRHQAVINDYKTDFVNKHKGEELYNMDFLGQPDKTLLYEELIQQVNEILDSLSERSKEVFVLSRMEGLKNKEIAEKLGLSVKTVEKHITIATKTLKNALSDKEFFIALILLAHFPCP
ncbi:RNA polymerase sigma-70 factor [Prevotella sp. KH2C16]|uniref:RNA polymerase sigma-70 factor n=1 Tax=Prevotella sp. KH2C16 TaxID=1855325 RepID=UPI0008EB69C7|nr:RNA polymerase sigma-70 factor [Prevotella sp. KH2C16]SFG31191.1 RNA polymerase sigma-70 factor, ECF subfamily [Prevotella sp. KH2C16]